MTLLINSFIAKGKHSTPPYKGEKKNETNEKKKDQAEKKDKEVCSLVGVGNAMSKQAK